MTTAPPVTTDVAWPSPGTTLAAKYEIMDVIGRGGTSVIYRARELGLGREVALKVLDARGGSMRAAEQQKKRFYRSARLMAQLTAPPTVRMHDYGRMPDGLLFLVFEFVDGDTLEQRLRRGPMKEADVRNVMLQVLESLREAHGLGFLHRDIKPANIMLYPRLGQPDGVKVLDYGIAKEVGEGRLEEVTSAGQVVGTPRYIAPERVLGKPPGAPSDLFCVGLVAYEMLVGQSPLAHLSGLEVAKALTTQQLELPSGAMVSEELRSTVNKLLEREPHRRFQSVDDVLAALGVDLAPRPRPKPGGSDVVAFPIGLDPLGGTPVDELTGTTSVRSLTVTSSSFDQLPAADKESPIPAATELEVSAETTVNSRLWPIALIGIVLLMLTLWALWGGEDAAIVHDGSETNGALPLAPADTTGEMNFEKVDTASSEPAIGQASRDIRRAIGFARMAAELEAREAVSPSRRATTPEKPSARPPRAGQRVRDGAKRPLHGRSIDDEPLEIEAMDELE